MALLFWSIRPFIRRFISRLSRFCFVRKGQLGSGGLSELYRYEQKKKEFLLLTICIFWKNWYFYTPKWWLYHLLAEESKTPWRITTHSLASFREACAPRLRWPPPIANCSSDCSSEVVFWGSSKATQDQLLSIDWFFHKSNWK